MRTTTFLPIVFTLVVSSACTEQYLPELRDPMPISVPGGQPAIGPRLAQVSDDSVNLSWMERGEDSTLLRFSNYRDGSWQAPIDVVNDAVMFVNWADLPAVVSTGPDALLAHWLSYTADGPYSYQVLTSQSSDGGASWSTPESPHSDATPTEHGFVSTYPDAAGTGLIWLDGRNTPDGGMTLRSAVVAADGELNGETVLDPFVCDCCQTDTAMTGKGPVAVYRNRTEAEVRDIYIARQIDGVWQQGYAVSDDGWVIAGCPVNGPAVAADGDRVVVAWFTGANNNPSVKTAVSTNAGKTFSTPVVVASKTPLGRLGIALVAGDSYVVSWLDATQDEEYAVNLRGLTMDGKLGRTSTVGRTSVTRAVPQMVRVGDKLVLAWTDEINEMTKVVAVKVPIAGFYE